MFFFNDTATTEIYTLSLHDALPIYGRRRQDLVGDVVGADEDHGDVRLDGQGAGDLVGEVGRPCADLRGLAQEHAAVSLDRKSTRLNSSHANISYAVFCLKKNKKAT